MFFDLDKSRSMSWRFLCTLYYYNQTKRDFRLNFCPSMNSIIMINMATYICRFEFLDLKLLQEIYFIWPINRNIRIEYIFFIKITNVFRYHFFFDLSKENSSCLFFWSRARLWALHANRTRLLLSLRGHKVDDFLTQL